MQPGYHKPLTFAAVMPEQEKFSFLFLKKNLYTGFLITVNQPVHTYQTIIFYTREEL